MRFKYLCFFVSFITLLFFSCSEDNDITVPRNLQEYLDTNPNRELENLNAFAASLNDSENATYIFYTPTESATEVRYYETENVSVDENDFSNYRRKNLTTQDIYAGKLRFFSRTDTEDSWCIVTYLTEGKLYKSDPIQIKINSKPTQWTNNVTIEYPETITPKFTWTDNNTTENDIYFQVISDEENSDGEEEFISGTYTKEKTFQFYDTSNVVLDINEGNTPEDLVKDEEYIFSMFGISEDNWANLAIQKSFVPRNLEEYVAANSTSVQEEIIAFGASANGSTSFSYIYYYPIEGATEVRYYETENATVNGNDLSNYRRVFLSTAEVFGDKMSRFSRTNSEDSWAIVTYLSDGKFHKSNPIRLKNQSKSTEWLREATIDFTESLKPKFSWADGQILENTNYFQVVTNAEDTFLSGTFTEVKEFQYGETTNVTSTINTTTPPVLILNTDYNFTLIGLSDDNWVNLVIQKSFTVE
ncbi:hypothetical protein H9W90_00015 [Polaribacter pectinis]|uniref:Uncharacterized protein n=1 Tax=Polaribacter pectinis TaxID=2738844 RepID=A0A7G9LA98_9FLAO|nr:hypothetical protein [Polaribacter pectinis]QNM85547.1 hypothetical protein H9W90_00015 [Polaribacter pectinis]